MLLGILRASLLWNILAGKGIVRACSGKKKRKRICESWLWKRIGFLMLPQPLTNFEIQKYYENEQWFDGGFSRDNFPKTIKDGYAPCHNKPWWICRCGKTSVLFCNRSEIVCFDSFGVEHVFKEIKEFAVNKNIIANIFRVQANNSEMCEYFCIGFIDFMLADKK